MPLKKDEFEKLWAFSPVDDGVGVVRDRAPAWRGLVLCGSLELLTTRRQGARDNTLFFVVLNKYKPPLDIEYRVEATRGQTLPSDFGGLLKVRGAVPGNAVVDNTPAIPFRWSALSKAGDYEAFRWTFAPSDMRMYGEPIPPIPWANNVAAF